ncbi:MAG: CocE/NonD family hydrolase [Rhodospirillaceae bacterium]|nr:CocE/NonD family hydrolase [Rhodospirillaceae bacterium]MBT6858707.1 CocE/NonD family hydrolase [Rhodospirillaceae bacterium]
MKTQDIKIPVRDGVSIAARIYLPDGEGNFPALFAASPYRYETDELPAHPAVFPWRETGPIEWYTDHGYAYVHADVRGTGNSEGEYGLLDTDEQNDLYDVIEWIGAQDWSNGKVGGIGQSYYCMSQWFMGIVNPPSLACIAPYDGLVDPYRDSVYHGGIYCGFMPFWYNMIRVNNAHRAADQTGGKLLEKDLVLEMIKRQTFDEWWQERTALHRIKDIEVPVLNIGVWGKVGLHLRGNLMAHENLTAPKNLVVTGGKNVAEAAHQFDKPEFHKEHFLPFYDQHLKGIESDKDGKSPVRLYIGGRDEYRDEETWPIERAEQVSYYLNGEKTNSLNSLNDGGLSTDASTSDESTATYQYPDPQWVLGTTAMGPQGPDPIRRQLTFTTEPLQNGLEVTGPITLELYASSDQPDTDFIVKISDQIPQAPEEREKGLQPKSIPVAKGWLKASHRDKDETLSTEVRPFYGHTSPKPLNPGEIYKFEIEIWPISHFFGPGHRLRLEIANGDSALTDQQFAHQYLPHKMGSDTFYFSEEHPSKLNLPVID